jgi:ATP-dependent DNA helicase RecQ
MIDRNGALLLLRKMLGDAAGFREGQWEAIDLVANQLRRALVVQRTGWGKSMVYFIATRILRDRGCGPTLLISPLLSLMRNQIAMAERMGVRAVTIHSQNREDWSHVEEVLRNDRCDVLLISPERLGNREFLDGLMPPMRGRLGLLVVDEAHCISDWGHDFRPDYRRIVRILNSLPPAVPALCTTATANNRVVDDILEQVPGLEVLRGPLTRRSLSLFNIRLDDQAERLAWLAQFLPLLPGSGVIYCLTVADARRVADWLRSQGIEARAYHADLEAGERVRCERRLIANEVKALVATVALGMGFDKPDLGFVIHFQRPGSVIAYYQQVGRAGRAVDSAYGILLSGREDDEIADYFIRTAFPPAEVPESVAGLLGARGGLSIEEISAELNEPRGSIQKSLKLLEVDGAVVQGGRRYFRTSIPWSADLLRADRVTALRRAEVEEMRRYVAHHGCLMEFLSRALDDPRPGRCGRCMNCRGTSSRRREPSEERLREAIEFLRRDQIPIIPRTRWPVPLLDVLRTQLPGAVGRTVAGAASTVIPERLRPAEGRALSVWGDAGWGRLVAQGKYRAGRFDVALVEASVRLVREQWRPEPPPQWITAVPSVARPELVRDFAAQLAERLGLPFLSAIVRRRPTEPQKLMRNSVMQVRNLLGAFATAGAIPAGPVLLVDDLVDSRWTMTLLAILLLANGSGPVFPFALACATTRGGG